MMLISSCCHAALKTENREEMYLGCDDDYALIIPFQVCTKCGEVQLTVINTEDIKKFQPEGARKYA